MGGVDLQSCALEFFSLEFSLYLFTTETRFAGIHILKRSQVWAPADFTRKGASLLDWNSRVSFLVYLHPWPSGRASIFLPFRPVPFLSAISPSNRKGVFVVIEISRQSLHVSVFKYSPGGSLLESIQL